MEFLRLRPGAIEYNRKRQMRRTLDYENERVWELNYLRARCNELNLEEEYKKYQIRLMTSYLGVFMVLHIAVITCYAAVLLLCCQYTHGAYHDVAATTTAGILLLLVLSVNFFEDFVQRHRWVMLFTSILATLFVVCADVYLLCMIYMFLPITSITAAAVLAFIVSCIYVLYFMQVLAKQAWYINSSAAIIEPLLVDAFHYLAFNLMGIFFRIMNDTMVRASFLDRHQFIVEENWLRHALQQESMLLDTTLPPQIAKPYQESIKNKIMQSDGLQQYGSSKNYQSSMTVQMHPDVSILYADVVNYTYLTTTLSVGELVKVLHDLYGRFDVAASMYKVQRIKFLGDCYYCVAGLGEADADHAENAVALGLSMIEHIQEVRVERQLDINMRIGVHSGSLFAGVIGQAKLQFDIWGVDVDIANHLEATGKPGFVHISGRTLSNLKASSFTILPGTEEAQLDPVLQKHPMRTFLISDSPMTISSRMVSVESLHTSIIDIKTRPVQGALQTNVSMSEELREEFRKMPVGGFELNRRHRYGEDTRREVGLICTTFRDSTLERDYHQQPDFLFKGSMLLAWATGICLIYIQIKGNETVCKECIVVDVFAFIFLTSLLFISWYKQLCWLRFGNDESKEFSRLSCQIFHVYEKIQRSLMLRITCYLLTIAVYYLVLSLILVGCNRSQFELAFIESKLFHYEVSRDSCFYPWPYTNMVALIIGLSYTFARIPFALKTCIACIEAAAYLVLFCQYQFVFQHSRTTAAYLPAEVAHCSRIVLMLITMYVKERQVEFNGKTNYRLNVNLKNKQKVANATNQSIIILLNNILPSHVVEHYLDSLAKHELYYENYQMVSVMFAKLMNFKMDLPSLRVLNCIITEFDVLLSRYKEYYLVEKIKVVGCTYMAACGLDFSLAASSRKGSSARNSRPYDIKWRRSRIPSKDSNDDNHEEVVYLMTTFALDLMRTLASCNRAYAAAPLDRNLSSTQIAIGISSGEIMAGVVGASQPHYDIWGNPVNMASRMQSTGLPGRIQVTEESANILSDFGVVCQPRGLTFVKGRGEIPTYFVAFDENLGFMLTEPKTSSATRITYMPMVETEDNK